MAFDMHASMRLVKEVTGAPVAPSPCLLGTQSILTQCYRVSLSYILVSARSVLLSPLKIRNIGMSATSEHLKNTSCHHS